METNISEHIKNIIWRYREAATLAVFRLLFGLLMAISGIRFWYNEWIEKLYILPPFHFKYAGFSWVSALPGDMMYIVFVVMILSAICVAIGYKYRVSAIIFFLTFTFVELIDKTTYLNHYYFVSVVSFIMIWLPAHRRFSIDAHLDPSIRSQVVPAYTINVIKLILSIVYIYAGLAKLHSDWMLEAKPLSIWLSTKDYIPLIGGYMQEKWLHYAFSWGGAVYDLLIVFLLLWKRTRLFGFFLVVVFHVMTRVLFPIGMFPFIMIVSTLIFFDGPFHEKILSWIKIIFRLPNREASAPPTPQSYKALPFEQVGKYVLPLLMVIQLLFPYRHLLHNENLFWTERGYRFGWRVMLMEKTGYAEYKIMNGKTGDRFYVNNRDFISSFQEKQMSTQPDFILDYGKYLGTHFASQGHENVEVYVDSYVSLNGRPSQRYIKPDVDLMATDYHTLVDRYITALNE